MIDFESLNRQLLAQARQLIPEWVPGGNIRGREYVAGALSGGPGESLSINLESGRWADFASPDARGGDLVSLYAAIHAFDQRTAALALGAVDVKTNGSGGHAAAPSVPRETTASPSAHEPADHSTQTSTLPPPGIDWTAQDFKHRHHGLPAAFWLYRSPEGAVLYAVARYDAPGGKQIVPWTHTGERWVAKSAPKPRALYGLDRLSRLSGPAIIVEGEKTADAAQRYFPENPCLTWSGGANAVRTADWSPLAGRPCILWPDNDDPGTAAMASLASILFDLGCSLQIITAEHKPTGWDLADAEPEDDIPTYAESHIRDLPKPGAAPVKKTTILEKKPPSLSVAPTIDSRPIAATPVEVLSAPSLSGISLDELYARHGFMVKASGRPQCNEYNVGLAVQVRGLDIFFDEFAQRIKCGSRDWDDHQNLQFMVWMQRQLNFPDIGAKTVYDGVKHYAFERRRNPLREWMSALKWDGTPRLAALVPRGFGTQVTPYFEAVGRCFLVGMVARVMQPGVKNDCMPVFEGRQGGYKSSALAIIGGEYFAEIHESITSKDFYIALQGKMLCEISELHAFSVADIERIKGIISTQFDRYREPYGVTASDHPRQGVFSGTTNRDDWNRDETGARRFWPVRCGQIDLRWLKANRDQLFAEAVHLYTLGPDCGGAWWDVPEEEAEAHREQRKVIDAWEDSITTYLTGKTFTRIPYVMADALDMRMQDMSKAEQMRVASILRQLGFRKGTKRVPGQDPVKGWYRE